MDLTHSTLKLRMGTQHFVNLVYLREDCPGLYAYLPTIGSQRDR